MSRLIRLGLRHGWRRGIVNGNRVWLLVGAAALLVRLLRRGVAREESVVYREVLQAGERLLITHEPRP